MISPRGRLFWRRVALVLAGAVAIVAVWVGLTPLPEELKAPRAASSLRVEDADGRLLREVRSGDGTRARFATLAEIGEVAQRAVLAAEDSRFYLHPGVDPIAVARAMASAVKNLEVVSGASTLTMQLARTVSPHPKTLRGKIGEMILALRIELSLSKERIFEEYVNRVAFGPNIRGFAAASWAYFDKPPANLSVAEAAMIAGLSRGPSLYSSGKHRALAEKRRNRVIERMLAAGAIEPDVAERARAEPMRPGSVRPAFGAPHLVQGIVGGALRRLQPGLPEVMQRRSPLLVSTTLDGALQRSAETALAAALADLHGKQVTAGSVVVIENATGDVLAYVGSPDFFDEARLGQNDGARALRQPGSALKPFLYAMAIEKLGFTAATALPDVESTFPTSSGPYTPHDYDGKVRGPIRLREALGNSLNIPAVWTLDQLGVEPFYTRLHELGFVSLSRTPDYYGLALALGDGEVTLAELANAYAALARGGVHKPLRLVRSLEHAGGEIEELEPPEGRRVMPALVAAQVTDILRDPHARASSFGDRTVLDFPFEVAAKTGTSKGYRDNWVAGYTDLVTVAVWVGNFDGSSMGQVSGITGAGPLFHAVMDAAMRRHGDGAARPRDAHEGLRRVDVCVLSGGLATADCPHKIHEFVAPGAAMEPCTMHERVRVTRQDGLRAGPACARADVAERTFERFGPEYLAWAEATGRALAPREFSPLCPRASESTPAGDGAVRFLYPPEDARFVMDPERAASLQVLDVRLAVPEGTREVSLLVDGRVVDRVRSPFIASWPLVPGEHTLLAKTNTGDVSEALQVQVRGL